MFKPVNNADYRKQFTMSKDFIKGRTKGLVTSSKIITADIKKELKDDTKKSGAKVTIAKNGLIINTQRSRSGEYPAYITGALHDSIQSIIGDDYVEVGSILQEEYPRILELYRNRSFLERNITENENVINEIIGLEIFNNIGK
jgi:hypothetical protein